MSLPKAPSRKKKNLNVNLIKLKYQLINKILLFSSNEKQRERERERERERCYVHNIFHNTFTTNAKYAFMDGKKIIPVVLLNYNQ